MLHSDEWDRAVTTPGVVVTDGLFEWVESPEAKREVRQHGKSQIRPDKEHKDVTFDPAQFAQLNLEHPILWWPAQMGTPELKELELRFDINGQTSDAAKTSFGIREITSRFLPRTPPLALISSIASSQPFLYGSSKAGCAL